MVIAAPTVTDFKISIELNPQLIWTRMSKGKSSYNNSNDYIEI